MKTGAAVPMLIVAIGWAAMVQAGDGPRFRGPAGDGTFSETGLLEQWPGGGPKVAWSAKGLGQGYSSAVVASATVYTTGMDEQRQGYLFAYAWDGALKWKTPYGPALEKCGPAVAGTRATPTVDGNRGLVCLEWKTGKVMCNAPAVGMGVVIAADGMLYIYAQNGTIYLVRPNPAAFEPVSQFAVAEGTNEHWAHPTIAHGRLCIRHGDALMVYDLRKS